MVKSQLKLQGHLLNTPEDLAASNIKAAGLAWLDMAVELFQEEVFSELALRWTRSFDGRENTLIIELDSSKNYHTRKASGLPGAPSLAMATRRVRLDRAVSTLLSRTTPEALWAALVSHRLASLHCVYICLAWHQKTRPAAETYPHFRDGIDLLDALTAYLHEDTHPWLT